MKKGVVLGSIFVVMLMIAGGTIISATKTEKVNDNLDKKNAIATDYEAEFKTYDTLLKYNECYPLPWGIYAGKLNQVMVCKKLCYDGSTDYDWYSVDWTAESVPDGMSLWFMDNWIYTDELLNNGILIDYGPFTNTGGTTTVSWTIGVTAGYKGAMVTASYSEAYAIQQIQIYVESDLSQNLAQWRHLSDPVSSYTQTYKPGIVFRVPQNTPLSSIKLSVNSAVEFFYWMGVLPVLIDWNITIGANLPPARPEPPSGPSLGDVGSTYEFSVLSADPEWSEITYEINWGDGHTSTKSAESDVVTVMSHAWDSKGTYSIQVRAKDERGEWSDWSQIHSIRINDNCCFPVGTRITMADGSHKNIENVKCGEKILSYNVFNGKFSSWTVFGVSHPIHPVYEINNGLLSLTKSHPLYVKKVNGKTGWGAIVPKREVVRFRGDGLTLEIGDQLLTSNKEWIKVTNITCNSVPIQTYNILSFWGKQNFFANDILVFEEHGSIPLLTKLYFLKFLDRYPNVFPILRHLLGY